MSLSLIADVMPSLTGMYALFCPATRLLMSPLALAVQMVKRALFMIAMPVSSPVVTYFVAIKCLLHQARRGYCHRLLEPHLVRAGSHSESTRGRRMGTHRRGERPSSHSNPDQTRPVASCDPGYCSHPRFLLGRAEIHQVTSPAWGRHSYVSRGGMVRLLGRVLCIVQRNM